MGRSIRLRLAIIIAPAFLGLARPAVADAPPRTPPAAGKGYSGHGASSVAPATLAKYAPPPLPAELTRSIQSMLDVRSTGSGVVSPDGKRLFFGWGITGTIQLWRLDGPRRYPVQLTGGEDPSGLAGLAPDGSFLVVSRDRNGDEYPGLYLQPTDGGPLRLINQRPKVQSIAQFISEDSRYVYYRANDVKPSSFALYRWDRQSGNKERIFDQDGLWSIADHRRDGRLLLTKELGSLVSEIYEWRPARGAAKGTLVPLLGQGARDEHVVRYGAAEGEILVLTPKLGEFRRLYRWRGRQLEPVTPEIKHDVSGFLIDEGRSRLVYTVNQEGYTRMHALDARTYRPVAVPPLPEADHVSPHSFSPDGRYLTVRVDTGPAPSINFVLDWKAGKATQWLLSSAPEVDLSRFVRATLEYYPARDGTRIPMFVRRPANCPAPCPVVVEFHGGPESQARPGFSSYAQLFVDAGFIYVEPNVRGSDGYGKAWLRADDGPRRLNVITDVEDCARFIREEWAAGGRAPKIGVVGSSYGGYAALMGMTMFAGAYDVGVVQVAPTNLLSFLQNTAPQRRALRINEYGDPDKDREALLKLSPTSHLDRLKGALMIMQGANDPRVPVGEAVVLQQQLEARGRDSSLIIFADEGHGSGRRGNRALSIGHTLRTLEQHLKGSPSRP